MAPNTVIERSAIRIVKTAVNQWQYSFIITLESGYRQMIVGHSHREDSAMTEALERSGRMIDKGYERGI